MSFPWSTFLSGESYCKTFRPKVGFTMVRKEWLSVKTVLLDKGV